MNFLALDLGTKTGFAYRNLNHGIVAGTWRLATPKETKDADRCCADVRLHALNKHLHDLFLVQIPKGIVFEDVQFSVSTAQTQLWSSFRTVVLLKAAAYNVKTFCCPVATLKKFATGRGNAQKEDMALALVQTREIDNVTALDDNAVDAAHLLRWAEHKIT